MKASGIGGQAVIEGVMMKNANSYAIAVRKPNKEVIVEKKEYIGIKEKIKFLGWPILRGVVAFIESLVIGMKTITFSAGFFEEEEEMKPTKVEKAVGKVFKEKAEAVIMTLTVIVAMALAIGIFMILPYFLVNLFRDSIESELLRAVLEGVVRITIFVLYVLAISQMKDIKRVFMYHGAEHKTINCLENGQKLNIKNVRKQTKEHKRCGTSFLLYVAIISIIFFAFIRVDTAWLRVLLRILLVPVIAGVAYEFIRLAGRSDSKIIGILSKPGLWLQGLTTREPEDEMIEVAIKSVEAVFDWEDFLAGGSGKITEKKTGTVIAFPKEAVQEPEVKIRPDKNKKKSSKNSNVNNRSPLEETETIKEKEETEPKMIETPEFPEKEAELSEEKKPATAKAVRQTEPEIRRSGKSLAAMKDSFEDDEEEDDEILKALDRYFVFDENKEE